MPETKKEAPPGGEMLPCPFCGGNPQSANDERGLYIITCTTCRCRTPGFRRPEDARQPWNRRTEVPCDSWPLPGSTYEDLALLYNAAGRARRPTPGQIAALEAFPIRETDEKPCSDDVDAYRLMPSLRSGVVTPDAARAMLGPCGWPGRHLTVGAVEPGDFPLPEMNPESFEQLHLVSAARRGCIAYVLTPGQIETLLSKGATIC